MADPSDTPDTGDATDTSVDSDKDSTAGAAGNDSDSKAKSQSLFDRLSELGLDMSQKYTSEDDLVAGLAQAVRLVGKKNDQAEAYNRILEAVEGREQEFTQFLKGEYSPSVDSGKKDDKSDLPTTKAEYQLLQARVYDDSGKIRPNADREDIRRLRAADERIAEVTVRMASDPKGFFKEALADFKDSLLKEINQQTSQQFETTTEQARLAEINKREAKFLYVGGEPAADATLTEWGKQAVETYSKLVDSAGLDPNAKHVRLWEEAISLTKKTVPKPKGTRSPNPHADHQTPIGGPKKSKIDEKAYFRKHGLGSLVPLLVKQGKLPASMLEEDEEDLLQEET